MPPPNPAQLQLIRDYEPFCSFTMGPQTNRRSASSRATPNVTSNAAHYGGRATHSIPAAPGATPRSKRARSARSRAKLQQVQVQSSWAGRRAAPMISSKPRRTGNVFSRSKGGNRRCRPFLLPTATRISTRSPSSTPTTARSRTAGSGIMPSSLTPIASRNCGRC